MAKNLVLITTGTRPPVLSKELLIAVILSLVIHGAAFFALTLFPSDSRTPAPILRNEVLIDLTAPVISEPEPETPTLPAPAQKPEPVPTPLPAEPVAEPPDDVLPDVRKEAAPEPVQQVEESTPSEAIPPVERDDTARSVPEPAPQAEERVPSKESPPVESVSPERPGPEAVPAVPSPAEQQERARDRTLKELYDRLSETLHYPPTARRRGTEGIVGVRLHIGADGSLLDALVVSTSGSRVLDNAALSGIKELFPYPHPIDTDEPFFLTMHITFALD